MSLFRVLTVVVILATSLLGSSCGFQLRGGVALVPALQSVYVMSGAAVANQVRSILTAAGATVHREKAEGVTVLQFRVDKAARRVLSVSSVGRALEYELERHVVLDIVEADGERTRLPRMVLRRELVNDEENVLGTTTQEEAVKKELVRDMALQVVRRLNVLLKEDGQN